MMKPLHYLMLATIMTFSVSTGNLLSNYLTAQYTAYQLKKAAETLEAERQAILEAANIDQAKKQKDLERFRRASTTGKNMLRKCSDWKKQNGQRDTEISRIEMEKSCQAYTKYIQTGRI